MTDADFLGSYDPAAFPAVAVTADVVLFTIRARELHVLLVRRSAQPARGRLALPGAFVRPDEDLTDTARRALREKAGLAALVRQFSAFGQIDRDPRMRIVSIAFMAVLPLEAVMSVVDNERELVSYRGDALRGGNGRKLSLPFDHEAIIATALADLRLHLDISRFSYGLLTDEFSLRELQEVHEAILGRPLNKPAFRKRLLKSGWLEATTRTESGKGFRPAELYRARAERIDVS